MTVRKVTISLPGELAEEVEHAVAAGEARSLSAYVAGALQERLTRREAFGALERLYGGRPTDEALAEARRVMGLAPRTSAQ